MPAVCDQYLMLIKIFNDNKYETFFFSGGDPHHRAFFKASHFTPGSEYDP